MAKGKKAVVICIALILVFVAVIAGIFIYHLSVNGNKSDPDFIEGAVTEVVGTNEAVISVNLFSDSQKVNNISKDDKVIIKYNSVSCDGENYSNPLEVGDTVSFSFWEADESTKDSQGYVTINVDDLSKLNRAKDSRFA